MLASLFGLGCMTVAALLLWWLERATTGSPVALFGFAVSLAYVACHLLPSWLIYLAARNPAAAPPRPEGLTVDVFVTACREPVELVERCLAAACSMRGPHHTYLLDDGDDPALADLAARFGAAYLTRAGSRDAKAGNVNAALPRSQGDVIALFDVDHIPAPEFLERTVGHFTDPKVGFVQVMVTFRNAGDTWVAGAVTETSLDFYNPTSIGMDAVRGVTKMGTNSLIRREALEGIGGYRPGLAEDLATSLALHVAGWQSRYVAEPLAPGLSPAGVDAWFTQQLKWARGVFEVLLTDFPRAYPALTYWQRLCYAVRMTSYWVGPLIALNLLATFLALRAWAMTGTAAPGSTVMPAIEQYVRLLLLVILSQMFVRSAAMAAWRHPSVRGICSWRAIALVVFTWPVYTLAWLMALLRVPLGFRPTPKEGRRGANLLWVMPQLVTTCLLVAAVGAVLAGTGRRPWQEVPCTLALALSLIGVNLIVFCQRLRPARMAGIARSRSAMKAKRFGA